jgi:hypothetical protein
VAVYLSASQRSPSSMYFALRTLVDLGARSRGTGGVLATRTTRRPVDPLTANRHE